LSERTARRAHALAVFALVVAALLAWFARARPELEGVRAPVGECAASETAWHARRVELAGAQADLAAPDRMLHPAGLRAPWPPLYESALALARELAPRDARAGVLAWSGPVLGTLAALAAALAVALWTRGVPSNLRWSLAAIAAAALALDPLLVASGMRAQLALAPANALLFALACACCAWAARARARLDLPLGALAAGLCGAGLALLSVPGAWAAGALALGWCAAALIAREERARELTRAALLHVLALAAVLAQPVRHAAFDGARALAGGALAAHLPDLLWAMAAGLLAAWAAGARSARARAALALAAAALVGMWRFAQHTRGAEPAAELALDRAVALAELGAEHGVSAALRAGAQSGLLAPLAAFALALILVRAVHARAPGSARAGFEAASARAGALAACALIVLGVAWQLRTRPAARLEAAGRATLARAQLLERVREATPASGSSHAPASAHDYAVLAPRGAQASLAWHARRAAASPATRARFEQQLARGEGPSALIELERAGVRALVLEASAAQELERQLAAAGATPRAWIRNESDWRALALQTEAPGSEPAPGASFEAGR